MRVDTSQVFDYGYFQKFKSKSRIKSWLLSLIDRKEPVLSRVIKKFGGKGVLLDCGCGDGMFLKCAGKYFSTAIGIDFSSEAVQLAKTNYPLAVYYVSDLGKIKMRSKVDCLTCFDVLEHVDKSRHIGFITSFYKHLNLNGVMIVSVPNTGSVMRYFGGSHWWANEDKTHISLLPRKYWLKLLNRSGFKVVKQYSSGLINHPIKPYALVWWQRPAQIMTQTLGLLGIGLPSWLSDVDYYVCHKG